MINPSTPLRWHVILRLPDGSIECARVTTPNAGPTATLRRQAARRAAERFPGSRATSAVCCGGRPGLR